MIVGISMGLETCLILGQASHNFTPLGEKAPDGYIGPGTNEETAYIQARSSMVRALEINGKARQAEGEAKVV